MTNKTARPARQKQFSKSRMTRMTGKIIILSLVVSLTTLGLVSARIRSRFFASKTFEPTAPSGFEPGNPAKEYVYAGSRLIATEEPLLSPTPTPTPFPPCTPPTGVIISEFRLRGAAGVSDEFVELYNNTDQALTICTADGSNGWAVVSSDATVRFVVPYNTIIPPRAHYLAVGSGYSLSSYATSDLSYASDAPDNAGLALFKTSNAANFTISNRLDAAGFTSDTNSLYREGSGLTPIGTATGLGRSAHPFEHGSEDPSVIFNDRL